MEFRYSIERDHSKLIGNSTQVKFQTSGIPSWGELGQFLQSNTGILLSKGGDDTASTKFSLNDYCQQIFWSIIPNSNLLFLLRSKRGAMPSALSSSSLVLRIRFKEG